MRLISFLLIVFICLPAQSETFWVKVKAENKMDRSAIADLGVSIESVEKNYIVGFADAELVKALRQQGWLLQLRTLEQMTLEFPARDTIYHDYQEMNAKLAKLAKQYPDWVRVLTIGKSVQGRDINLIHITDHNDVATQKPVVAEYVLGADAVFPGTQDFEIRRDQVNGGIGIHTNILL